MKKAFQRAGMALLCVAVGLLVGGSLAGDLTAYWIGVVLGTGVLTVMASGAILGFLANWTDRLSEKWFSIFIGTWMVGWVFTGMVGMLLLDNSTLAELSQLAGLALAFSIPAIRLGPSIWQELTEPK